MLFRRGTYINSFQRMLRIIPQERRTAGDWGTEQRCLRRGSRRKAVAGAQDFNILLVRNGSIQV